MPSEKFYKPTAIEGDGSTPVLDIAWGGPGQVEPPDAGLTPAEPGVYLNGERFDRSGVNRLITVLRRARDRVYGTDA